MKIKTRLGLISIIATSSAILIFFFLEYLFLQKDLTHTAYRDLKNIGSSIESQLLSFESQATHDVKILVEGALIETSFPDGSVADTSYESGKVMLRAFYYANSNRFSYIHVLNKDMGVEYAFSKGFEIHPQEKGELSKNVNREKMNALELEQCAAIGTAGGVVNYICRSGDTHSSEKSTVGYAAFGVYVDNITRLIMNAYAEFGNIDESKGLGLFYIINSADNEIELSSNVNDKNLKSVLSEKDDVDEIKFDDYYMIKKNSGIFGGINIFVLAPINKYTPLAHSVYARLALIIVLSFFVSLIISNYFARTVTKPFKKLMEAIGAIKKGNYNQPVVVAGDDELSHFAQIIEEMKKSIIEQQRIIKYNAAMVAIGQTTATVAHDVRKPLNNMRALLAALPSIKDKPELIDKMIESVDDSISQINSLLGEILEFSRDSSSLTKKDYNPQKIITLALSNSIRNHPQANINIKYDMKHTRSIYVDSNRMVRVFTNIFDNAIEAIESVDLSCTTKSIGSVYVETCDFAKDGKDFVGITVYDDGVGIPEDVLDKIFNIFFTYNKKEGTGLGLAICKRIIELHDGAITVGNRKKYGAEFVISLPAGDENVVVNEADLIRDSGALDKYIVDNRQDVQYSYIKSNYKKINSKYKRILIINDDGNFVISWRILLQSYGFEVFEAAGARAAFESLKNNNIDCILSDIDLGANEPTGYDVLKEVRKNNKNIPFYMISGQTEYDEKERATKFGASGYLQLPVDIKELEKILAG